MATQKMRSENYCGISIAYLHPAGVALTNVVVSSMCVYWTNTDYTKKIDRTKSLKTALGKATKKHDAQ